MLHHYNYSTSLSHFLNYRHQLDEQNLESNNLHPNLTSSKVLNGDGTGLPTRTSSPPTLCDDGSQDNADPRCRSNSSATNNNKSFTIAAILGLKNHNSSSNNDSLLNEESNDLSVVNLSVVHPAGTDSRNLVSSCSRLQLPVHRHSVGVTTTGHYSVGHGCPARQTVRGLKHLSTNILQQQKKSCKSKRVRTIFTPEQLERLEAEFERQQYMVGPERLYLAHTLQLTEAQVKVWFQNRRIKWRKHHLELTHQRLAVLKQQQLLLDDSHPDIQDTNSSSTDT